jgi:hypothetical protein
MPEFRDGPTESRAAMKRHGLRVAGAVPYGYTTDARTKQRLADRRESLHVCRMFQMAAEGKKPAEIAEIANHCGWRTSFLTAFRRFVYQHGNLGPAWLGSQPAATWSNSTWAAKPNFCKKVHDLL